MFILDKSPGLRVSRDDINLPSVRSVRIFLHQECTYSAILSRLKAPSRQKGLKRVIYPLVSATRVWNGSDYFRVTVLTLALDSHFAEGEEEEGRRKRDVKKIGKRVTHHGSREEAYRFLKRFVMKERSDVILMRDPGRYTLPHLT